MCIIVIIDEYYFDLTKYSNVHPGGNRILKKFHLKDATEAFNAVKGHGDEFALNELEKYCIGAIKDIDINLYIESNY